MQNYLKNCTNLVQFVVRISQNYFPRVVKAYEEELATTQQQQKEKEGTKSRSSTANNTEEEDGEWPHQTRNKVYHFVESSELHSL